MALKIMPSFTDGNIKITGRQIRIHNIQDYKETRRVRVFISSTFNDMKAERDAMARFVFPEVRAYARKRGVDFDFVDLRWGITDEEASQGMVIEHCLRSIDNCRPLFVGILGANYGWIPEKGELKKNPNLSHLFPWLPTVIGNKSMTEIEIYYGAFLVKGNSLFMIRDDINQAPAPQQALLSYILKNHAGSCNRYADIGKFCKKVKDFILKFIDAEFPNSGWTPREQYFMDNRLMLNTLSLTSVVREETKQEIERFFEDKDARILFICGGVDTGEKDVCAYLINQVKIRKMGCLYDFQGDREKINRWQKQEYNNLATSGEKGVIVLADADFLGNTGEESVVMEWLMSPNENIKFVLCTQNPRIIIARLKSRVSIFPHVVYRPLEDANDDLSTSKAISNEVRIIDLGPFNDKEASEYIALRLAKVNKSLPQELIKLILANPVYRLPHLLDSLLTELINLGIHENLSQFLHYFIDNVRDNNTNRSATIANRVFGRHSHNSALEASYNNGGVQKVVFEPEEIRLTHIDIAVKVHDEVLGDLLCSRICEFLSTVGLVEENAVKYCLGLSHYDWARFINTFSHYLDFNNQGIRLKEFYYTDLTSEERERYNDLLLEYYEIEPPVFYDRIIVRCWHSSDPLKWLIKYLDCPAAYSFPTQIKYIEKGWRILLRHDSDIFYKFGFDELISNFEDNGYMAHAVEMLCDYFPDQENLISTIASNLLDKLTSEEAIHFLSNVKKGLDTYKYFKMVDYFIGRYDAKEPDSLMMAYLKANKLALPILEVEDEDVSNDSLEKYIAETDEILGAIRKYGDMNALAITDMLYTRGCFFAALNRNTEAICELENALVFATEESNIVDIHLLLARIKIRMEEMQSAITEIDIALRHLPDSLVFRKNCYNWYLTICALYEKIGEYSAARYYLQNCLREALFVYEYHSIEVAQVYRKLAEVNDWLGDYESAAAYYIKYIESAKNFEDNDKINDARAELVSCLHSISKFSSILDIYLEIPEGYGLGYITNSVSVWNYYCGVVFAAHAIHQHKIARKVLMSMLPAVGEDSSQMDTIWYLLASVNIKSGNLELAKLYASKLLNKLYNRGEIEDEEYAIVVNDLQKILAAVQQCESGKMNWEETEYASRNVCKEWIDNTSPHFTTYAYFTLNNYTSSARGFHDSGDDPVAPEIIVLREPEIIAKQNKIMDSWRNLRR